MDEVPELLREIMAAALAPWVAGQARSEEWNLRVELGCGAEDIYARVLDCYERAGVLLARMTAADLEDLQYGAGWKKLLWNRGQLGG
ncbi:hypothetical protein AB0L13_03100 [Saccharopolyspora shandongensis]|uniref:hypothetical protein n=1 Tax=Saccharopolyspora shandongensis TaxID=418495 RepID=UPI00341BB7C3